MTYRRSFQSAFFVLGVFAFAGCRPAAPVAGPAPEADASPAAVVIEPEALDMGVVSIGTARSVERADQFEAAAVLALDESHTSRIGSVVDGVVVAVHAQVGDRVQPGTILGALHSHRIHDAWAAYRTAVADARRQETEVSYAVDNEARALRLFDAKALSAQELARARVDRIAAEEALEMARTEVRRSEEDLEHLGIRRDSATGGVAERIPVRTPVGGVVLERLVTQGTAVTPGAQLFVVSNLAQLWALVEVDEARLSSLAVGRDASSPCRRTRASAFRRP